MTLSVYNDIYITDLQQQETVKHVLASRKDYYFDGLPVAGFRTQLLVAVTFFRLAL